MQVDNTEKSSKKTPFKVNLYITTGFHCYLLFLAFTQNNTNSIGSDNVNIVNRKSAVIAKKLNLENRMEIFTDTEAKLLIKDHKSEKFRIKTKFDLFMRCTWFKFGL